MKPLFNRWLPALSLALWGGIILYYTLSGHLSSLLMGQFQTYAVVASGVLLAGALLFAFYPADASCCVDSACSHGLSRSSAGRALSFGIILLPIALAPFASSAALQAVKATNCVTTSDASALSAKLKDQLDKKFANRIADQGMPAPAARQLTSSVNYSTQPASPAATTDSTVVPGSVQPPPPLPLPSKDGSTPPALPAPATPQAPTDYLIRSPEGNIVAEVIDLLYAAQDNTLRADFEGKRVELVGQFMPDPTNPQRFKAVRMFITCCAADARPVATLVETDKLPDVKEMEWVKIIGTPTFPVEHGRRISVLKAEKVMKTEPIADDLPPQ